MPRITAEREEATRRRILEAAESVFADRGFHDASIDDVVRASGLSVGAIYSYFHGKDELVQACCLKSINEAIDGILADLRTGGTVRQNLDRALDAWFAWLEKDSWAHMFLIQSWAAAAESQAIRDTLIRRRERIATVGAILIREGVENGELRADIDVERIARGIAAMLDGTLLERAEEGSMYRLDAVRRRIQAFMDLLVAPAAPGGAQPRGPEGVTEG